MAAIIVASLLWLPSDCTGRTAALDAGPAEVAPVTAAEVASTAAAEAPEEETVAATTMTTGRTSATGQFSVQMLLPFSKSTIRYSYTEPTGSASSARTSARTEDVDQAHSVSVSSYGCGTVTAGGGDDGGQRKRKRVRWKTTALPGAAENERSVGVTTRAQTNTIVPLPGYPTADSGRGAVFEAAAEQLDQLYTVSRVAGTVSGSGGDAEAISEDGTTDALEDSTVK